MRECRQCGATWERGGKCPYCKSVNYIERKPTVVQNQVQSPKKDNRTALIIVILSILILTVIVIVVIVFSITSVTKNIENDNLYSYTDPTLSESNKAYQREKGIYTGNGLEVGKDIPEGEYLVMYKGTSSYANFCLEVYTDPDDKKNSTIYSEWKVNCGYVVLEKGTFVDTISCAIYDLEKNDIELDPFKYSGMYKVGRDLEAGTYIFKPETEYSGSYAIYKSLNSIAPVIRESNYISSGEEQELTVKDGEYIEISYGVLQNR